MDLTPLVPHWPELAGAVCRAERTVANNVTYIADAPSGAWVVRVYQNHRDAGRIRYEHAVLRALQGAALSFAVPAPILTVGGATLAPLASEDGPLLVSVSPFVVGTHPEEGDAARFWEAGRALAELDRALAQVRIEASPDVTSPVPFGEVARFHPEVPDPLAAVDELPVDAPSKARMAALFRATLDAAPDLYRRLPQQIIHNDYDASNILMRDGRVVAVLDFEFSTWGLRVVDLVIALHTWAAPVLGTGEEWPILDAIGRGYGSVIPILPAEAEALPLILRVNTATGLAHRMGRYRLGLNSAAFLAERVASIIALEAWLEEHGATLVRHARRWGQESAEI